MPDVLIIIGSGNTEKSDLVGLEFLGEIMVVGKAIRHYKGTIDAFAIGVLMVSCSIRLLTSGKKKV